MSVHTGSKAGGVIYATVIGVGVDDYVTLVKESTNNEICETATVISYNLLECVTKAEEVGKTTLGVKDLSNSILYDCGAIAGQESLCEYETWDEGKDPLVDALESPEATAITLASPTQIVITGENFTPLEYNGCRVEFAGVEADTCTVDNSQ